MWVACFLSFSASIPVFFCGCMKSTSISFSPRLCAWCFTEKMFYFFQPVCTELHWSSHESPPVSHSGHSCSHFYYLTTHCKKMWPWWNAIKGALGTLIFLILQVFYKILKWIFTQVELSHQKELFLLKRWSSGGLRLSDGRGQKMMAVYKTAHYILHTAFYILYVLHTAYYILYEPKWTISVPSVDIAVHKQGS